MNKIKRITAILLAGCCCVMSCIMPNTAKVHAESSEPTALEIAESAINATNDIRVSMGLRPLATTPLLLELTAVRAEELTIQNSHTRPNGSPCFSVLKSAGFTYLNAGENIAAGNPDPLATVNEWMKSDDHRNSMLDEARTHIAVARVYDPDAHYSYYWAMFLLSVYDGSEPHVYEDQYIPGREVGDPNGSHSINASDAALILDYSATTASGKDYPVVDEFEKAADVNGDGIINSIDASIILTYSVKRSAGINCKLEDFIW